MLANVPKFKNHSIESVDSKEDLIQANSNANNSRKWLFNSRLVLLISFIIIIILSVLLDVWYHFQTLPTVQLKTGSLYLDKSDSTLQLSVIGRSDSLIVKNHKLSSQSYLSSYELQDTKCILSYDKDIANNEWFDVGYLDVSAQVASKETSNEKDIQFHLILNEIVFKHFQDVVYLTYWYEPHAMKLQCTTGIIL